MATVNSLVTKIKAVLAKCNAFTGQSDNTLSDAVDHVIAGASGTDVSDTTATASDVLAGKDFHLADGSKTSGTIETIADSAITQTWDSQYLRTIIPKGYLASQKLKTLKIGTIYPADIKQSIGTGQFFVGGSGYVIKSLPDITPSSTPEILPKGAYYLKSEGTILAGIANVTPSTAGTYFSSGIVNMSRSGYAYSEKPSASTTSVSVSTYSSLATFTINTNLSTVNFFVFQYYETNGRTSYVIYNRDMNATYCSSAYRSSGGSASSYLAFSSTRQAYQYSINSISGGNVTLNVPTNANYKQDSGGYAKWFAC